MIKQTCCFHIKHKYSLFLIEQKKVCVTNGVFYGYFFVHIQPTVWPMKNDVLISLTKDYVTLDVPCDWTKYFPFPVVYTYTWRSATETHGGEEKNKNKTNTAFYNRISLEYGRPGSDSRPPAPAVHRNRVSETAISAAGASNDRGLLGKITSKLAVSFKPTASWYPRVGN